MKPFLIIALACLFCLGDSCFAEEEFVPRRQSKLPGPALTPAEAMKKMVVPDGFHVELVAAEPDIVNPVGMTFDERGRIWITESLEYPRKSPGKGKDRIKVLEDTTGDGKADKVTIFADGLNIPSGIAVGHGGVWVANSPDLLFMQDTNGDGKADKSEVLLTGFGRSDTHELPNSLTWGPDGWLYGINGVFNPSVIEYRGKTHKFTCALFRIHPKTRDFEVFAEGTSNPWGVAFDGEGSAFFSACVIDHLWHMTESGYYHRQGGPYPPFTWKIGSIVKHKHQAAAYCGIHYFDSDAYPKEYRKRLYMGNIHGGCINVDEISRKGSSYFGKPNADFLTANDVWFMPVVQKTGPDGSLYVLDWYDRYHCYQDANRDPKGIDRLNGRLYRIRYKQTPRVYNFDLAKESDDQLIKRLFMENDYFRSRAQRVLTERNSPTARVKLQEVVLDETNPKHAKMHALWALIGTNSLQTNFHLALLNHKNPSLRAWGVRAAGNFKTSRKEIVQKITGLAHDASPDVQLQVAIAAKKLPAMEPIAVLVDVLNSCGNDELIPHIVWQNLHPFLEDQSEHYLKIVQKLDLNKSPNVNALMTRVADRILVSKNRNLSAITNLLELLVAGSQTNSSAAENCLELLAEKIQTGEIASNQLQELKQLLHTTFDQVLSGNTNSKLYTKCAFLAASLGDKRGINTMHLVVLNKKRSEADRLSALQALISSSDDQVVASADKILAARADNSILFRGRILDSLGKMESLRVAKMVLEHYPEMEAELKPKAIELLTQRPSWSLALVDNVRTKKVDFQALNVNQIRKLLVSKDEKLAKEAKAIWGLIRTERNPQREEVIVKMRKFLQQAKGNPHEGEKVFKKLCAQCHKMYGDGFDIGPDITRNGRGNFEQLLSNVFDPSLVIGAAYQARTVVTVDGRVLTGLLSEDNAQRIVLKMQGGKLETIPRDQIEELVVSKLSMMPEGLEKQIKPDELANLFAYITLDKPPSDKTAKLIPGTQAIDVNQISLPSSVENLLVGAKIHSNAWKFKKGVRGRPEDPIFDPKKKSFIRKSTYHEHGVGSGRNLGVLSEENAVFWLAKWDKPVKANLIILSGTYPNQPQPNTAWKIEYKVDNQWRLLDRGVGGWYNTGRYLWGGSATPDIEMSELRISVYSPDDKTEIGSIHFRGEKNMSWFAGHVSPADQLIPTSNQPAK